MEYTAVYEPDMQAFGILDLQLLHRYLSPVLSIEALLEGSNIDALNSTHLIHTSLWRKKACCVQ